MADGPTSAEVIARSQAAIGPCIYRYTDVAFARGDGAWLYDFEGKAYLDFAAGIATNLLGHGHPAVKAVVLKQVDQLVHPAAHIGAYLPPVELAEFLQSVAGPGLRDGKVVYSNSGSEAIETMLKLARVVTGRPAIIGFLGGFHGRPMGALAATASQAGFRLRLSGLLGGVYHAPFPQPGAPLTGATDEERSAAALQYLRWMLQTEVPAGDVAGILVEPIQGEGGYYVAPPAFLQGLRQICDETGALLLVDEVQTGLGRTGKWFGFQHAGIEPDAIALAKPIGAGFPLGTVLARRQWMDAWPPGAHGSTFGGNPVACAAGLAALRVVEEENLVPLAAEMGAYLQQRLEAERERLPLIRDVRGRGLMVAMEVGPAAGQTAEAFAAQLVREVAGAGLITTKCGARALRFTPPLNITRAHVDQALEIVFGVLRRYAGETR